MSESNIIRDLLGIQEENIEFLSEVYEIVKNGRKCQLIDAKLTHKADHCLHCGTVAENFNIIKNGTTCSLVRLPKASKGYDTRLKLKKPRFLCKSCNRSFQLPNSIVKPHCNISTTLKQRIMHDATMKQSETEIAYNNHVSHSTVNRFINEATTDEQFLHKQLPKVLCWDEFKSTKYADGAMSFIFMDPEKKQILDIIEDRRLHNLSAYFKRHYTKQARDMVQYIVIDMYEPYVQLIKECFPNAKIVCDKFHIIQLVNRALNAARIEAMKRNPDHHTKFKNYWKLVLMDSVKLKRTRSRYCRSFRAIKSQAEIVEFLLSLDETLKATYDYYQRILLAIFTKNEKLMGQLLSTKPLGITDKMDTARKSLLKFLNPVLEALRTTYSNGILEGTNNLIKVIKRIAFGYRCFYNFKKRILLIHNHNPIKLRRYAIQIQKDKVLQQNIQTA